MTKTQAPKHKGSRIEFDGRTGTLLTFAALNSRNGVDAGRWAVVFDDRPGDIVIIDPHDHDRVRDITPKPVAVGLGGRAAYAIELPEGTYHVMKRGAYWYPLDPGMNRPPSGSYSGLNTRTAALSMVLDRHAHRVTPTAS